MDGKRSGWLLSATAPRSRTEQEAIDDGDFEGTLVRTVRERTIIGVPHGVDPDADEIEKLIQEHTGRATERRDDEQRRPSDEFLSRFQEERDESVREIRDMVSKEVHQFETARLKLHHLLHKPCEEPKAEIKDPKPPLDWQCARCRDVDLEVLIEENRILKQKLAENQLEQKEEFTCKCQMAQKVNEQKREEASLLETIGLKMERLDALNAQAHEVDLNIEQTRMKLCGRLAERNKIENLLQTSEESFNFKCKQVKDFQAECKRFEEKTKKLRDEHRAASAQSSEAEKRVKSLHSQLTKLQAECRAKEEAVLKHRGTMVQLDDTAVKLRSEIKNLKDELQMLAESLKFHRSEVEERHKEARALNLDEQQAEKQLEAQKRITEAQKRAVATELERTKALEFVAHNCLKESEELSKALQRLRVNKRSADAELVELQAKVGSVEVQIEAEVERLETLKETLRSLREERGNVGEMLLQQVRKDKSKIRALLDDIDSLAALLCEAVCIRSIIDKDNRALEHALESSRCPEEQAQEVFDLEQQIDKHKRLIAALGEKVDSFEASHQNSEKGATDEDDVRVVRLTYHRLRELSQQQPDE